MEPENKYEKIDKKPIGKGASASVYAVRRITDNEKLAMKVIKLPNQEDEIKNFLIQSENEVNLLKNLKHEYILEFVDVFFSENNELCIVTELAEGGSLKDKRDSDPLENQELVKIFWQISVGVQYMHSKNVMHRDLKLENILLTKSLDIKIADLGQSKALDTLSQLANTYCGTRSFMAPEVHEGNRYTFAADIWSLGCILYQLVTGESAFYSLDSVKLKQKVKNLDYKHLPQSTTDEVREIVEGCLIVNPDERITIQSILNSKLFQNFQNPAEEEKV